MKYNQKIFNNLVKEYESTIKKQLGVVKEKLFFVVLGIENKKAFFSLAPLSMAVHNLGGDMHVIIKKGYSNTISVLKDMWETYDEKISGIKNKKVNALSDFISAVEKRTKKDYFKNIFNEPEIIIDAEKNGFSGTIDLEYGDKWYKPYKVDKLMQTAKIILTQGYNLKEGERMGIGFELVPSKKNLGLPLEDYLDSFSIAYSMALQALKLKTKVGMSAYSNRMSFLVYSVRSGDLLNTLIGCELDKEVDEEIFRKFKVLSKALKISRLETNDAAFGIHGKGYPGRFFFGECVGYPTLNKKTRWTSPAQMMMKDRYESQTEFETRDPMMRYGMTETLPLDIFIDTCNVDYDKIRKRSLNIKNIVDKCEKIRVVGKKVDRYKTNLEIGLICKNGKRREFIASDSDLTSKIDWDYYKKTGKKTGCYANFPSGEAFSTPETVNGIFVGDVVINVDQSYRITKKEPLIIEIKNNKYRIVKGPKNIVSKMKKFLLEAKDKIKNYEESKSLPASMIKMYKENFYSIGEFAINTNPKAKLCDYLIVNEKIARMIHLALGMGFEPDRKTVYHWDIVVDSPRQKLDIFGIDKKGKEHWIIKKGDFVV